MRVVDDNGIMRDIGQLKIGQKGLKPSTTISLEGKSRRANIRGEFAFLNDDYFSLGQSESYYEALNELDEELKKEILIGLRDCAYDKRILNENLLKK